MSHRSLDPAIEPFHLKGLGRVAVPRAVRMWFPEAIGQLIVRGIRAVVWNACDGTGCAAKLAYAETSSSLRQDARLRRSEPVFARCVAPYAGDVFPGTHFTSSTRDSASSSNRCCHDVALIARRDLAPALCRASSAVRGPSFRPSKGVPDPCSPSSMGGHSA